MTPIYFYIPESQLQGPVPEHASEYWQWRISKSTGQTFLGKFDWTLQTYLWLKEEGFPCELAKTHPSEGIVVSHKDFLDEIQKPTKSTLLVCLKSDRRPHRYAQAHIVQNPEDRVPRIQEQLVKSFFVPHWVQPLLVPRAVERGDRFENIGYVGSAIELDSLFQQQSWHDTLKGMGFDWMLATTSDTWSDYSALDALVALRKCNSTSEDFTFKPATKLYNAWHAGIPAILGVESAYRAERKSDLDYLEAESPEEVIRALERLRNDKDLRKEMVRNGRMRALETRPENIVKIWEGFLTHVAIPAYKRWCGSGWVRSRYFSLCLIQRRTFRILRKISKNPASSLGY
jgi:hypothetical protein